MPKYRVIASFILYIFTATTAQAVPNIQHWTTGSGLRVYFAEAPGIPMLDLKLMVDAGSARDGEKAGLASMTNSLLDQGSGDLDADAIAYRFESVGANFSNSADLDSASASLRTLTDPELMESALDTFVRVVGSPSFPEKDFLRIQRLTLVGLEAQKQQPQQVASKAFYAALYGDHPFGHPGIGTEESVASIKGADIKAFYEKHYSAKNAVLAVIGAVDRGQVEAIAERIAKALPEGKILNPIPEVAPLTANKVIDEPFPSEQAHVFIGQPGTYRGDPDYFTLYVGNQVLGGGGFTSRLVKKVRIERGLSYSVYSFFSPAVVAGPFQSGLQTRADQAHAAADLATETIKTFIEEGPTDDELKDAIDNLTGGFPLRIDSNSDLLEYLAAIGYYKLPLDYIDTWSENVASVTGEQIRETFKRRLDTSKMVRVTVGATPAAKEPGSAAHVKETKLR